LFGESGDTIGWNEQFKISNVEVPGGDHYTSIGCDSRQDYSLNSDVFQQGFERRGIETRMLRF
jgi:hypothetical protein